MRSQGLRGGLAVSLLLHLLIVASVVVATLYAQPDRIPVPYVVSLVDEQSPSSAGSTEQGHPEAVEKKPESPPPPKEELKQKVAKEPRQVLPSKKPVTTKPAGKHPDEASARDRIAAIAAKKRIEKMAALRKIVEVGGNKGAAGRGTAGKAAPGAAGKDYYSQVMEGVKKQWIFPESLAKNLEAIVAIRVAADGKVTIVGMEKGSGNPLFDKSVIRAITMASPFPPPAKEMEIGIRFRP
ncbi:MAG: cell envelope integrity protein TolA [Nitrospirales bacterium]|nr:cell envelope integrity protein TolA [Nitrospirales bacterium]